MEKKMDSEHKNIKMEKYIKANLEMEKEMEKDI